MSRRGQFDTFGNRLSHGDLSEIAYEFFDGGQDMSDLSESQRIEVANQMKKSVPTSVSIKKLGAMSFSRRGSKRYFSQ